MPLLYLGQRVVGQELREYLSRSDLRASKAIVEEHRHVRLLEGGNVNINVDDLVIGRQSPETLDPAIALLVEQGLLIVLDFFVVFIICRTLMLS